MLCPVCKNVELVMSERQGIEIDYCPDCRGVWLDRGELDKIIERSLPADVRPQPQADHQADRRLHGHGKHHGHDWNDHHHSRRSFWKDLFD